MPFARFVAGGLLANETCVRLKLQFFRSLGIDVSQDSTTGEFNRAVIRNMSRGDVNVINVDGKMSRNFYANMFWDSM